MKEWKTNKLKIFTIFLGHCVVCLAYHSMLKSEICMPKPLNKDVHINTFHGALLPLGMNKQITEIQNFNKFF